MLLPFRMLAQNVPVKLSPAPTVSATSTFGVSWNDFTPGAKTQNREHSNNTLWFLTLVNVRLNRRAIFLPFLRIAIPKRILTVGTVEGLFAPKKFFEASSKQVAGPFSSLKNRQPVSSSSLLNLIHAFASLLFMFSHLISTSKHLYAIWRKNYLNL